MDKDQVKQEVIDLMEDRGYDAESAISKVSRVSGLSLEEVKVIVQDGD